MRSMAVHNPGLMSTAALEYVEKRSMVQTRDTSSNDDRRRAGKALIPYVPSYIWGHLSN
jgi:hypothetical protein